ncbi:GNAT family N-acetyltransferase [Niastella yeongjuensis]|uniref:GNAT family N-acetyltransferase n=1 Tax=Niastella yeongjuensis TaxID=354355 RepID=A0A1V9E400_9BACT|nr:GNAT family N-acetyltransferase [Niastella yeongjuensis]OQP40826.1 GNAT family N-acetyltransferase [Niastella yeongjuensis]SEP00447.1 Acetyltransferase (GNAT) domain-containing protein [Niastella yeongjuensis]
MIVPCNSSDIKTIHDIINDGASAYKGIIPADRWHEPYMTMNELQTQIGEGVEFWCCKTGEIIEGVMGIQFKDDVTLIRHAYVRTAKRNSGIGGKLLTHLRSLTETRILIGTWTDAKWAIAFYEKHGFRLVTEQEKNSLLRRYWNIPERQVETSVVLTSDPINTRQ